MVIYTMWEMGWCVACIVEGCLIKSKTFFNINPGFGGFRPIIFAAMGPNFNQEAKSQNHILKNSFYPYISPSEKKLDK